MDRAERIKMVKAMEYITRRINDEEIFQQYWLTNLEVIKDCFLDDYIDDVTFGALMETFLHCMMKAYQSGGLYCDEVESE